MTEAVRRGSTLLNPNMNRRATDPENPETGRRITMTPRLATSMKAVMGTIRAHLGDTSSEAAATPSGRPKFDDLSQCDVSDADEDKLWQIEAKRLFDTVEDMSTELTFKSYGVFSQPDGTSLYYDELAELAEQILVNLHICRFDNELALLCSASGLVEMDAMGTSELIIKNRLLDNPKPSIGDGNHAALTKRYFATVDYITAVAARLAVSAVDDEMWQRRTLASLAKCSAKLKMVFSRGPREYVSRSIRSKQVLETEKQRKATEQRLRDMFDTSKAHAEKDMAERARDRGDGNVWDNMPAYPGQSGIDDSWYAKELDALLVKREDNSPPADLYLSHTAWGFRFASSTLLKMVYPLVPSTRPASQSGTDRFDLSTTTYQAGTSDNQFPIYMHQDRNGELHGSNQQEFIKHAYLGFSLVKQAIRGIRKGQKDDGQSFHSGTVITLQMQHISGDVEEKRDVVEPPKSLGLSSLADIIAVMIPLLCTSPDVIWSLQSFLKGFGEQFSIDAGDLAPRTPDFTAMASLRTRAFQAVSPTYLPGADFRQLSRSMLIHSGRQVSHPKIPTDTGAWDKVSSHQIKQVVDEIHQRQQRLAQDGRDWDIEETTVGVNCVRYVYTVLALAGLLVAGGLTAAFTIGDRLEGVDPFGIATFSWVLAAFLILIAKSVRVTEWPWRSFLQGRVTCRSLSELRAVTGANEQDLILYLLTNEQENVLVTRGPYNRLFTRKGDSGFSIDVKPEVRTLVAAGIILVKVALRNGSPALVCFDLRRVGEGRDTSIFIKHDGRAARENSSYICRYPPRPGDRIQDVLLDRVPVQLWWVGILGIYNAADTKVR
ncbi:hypothetical protein B0T25DRAFT_250760 [Lasiosphaeria hispida]|uniref:Uncharacterized protein n=1 Tax=Lasiosphaeria hispida TaxID=260671 RepID=A0AAJ0MCR2_9PEZI|nr:hypothetical protein B0T25DRAFT_250760 [Lasiosphaeria hispida]